MYALIQLECPVPVGTLVQHTVYLQEQRAASLFYVLPDLPVTHPEEFLQAGSL